LAKSSCPISQQNLASIFFGDDALAPKNLRGAYDEPGTIDPSQIGYPHNGR
jgi:hypothetical protein